MIPIYRAKKIASNENIIGFLIKKNYYNKVRYFLTEDRNIETAMTYEIDPATLAIHFSDMLDSQGNKIFAALTQDGKGGDLYAEEGKKEISTFIFSSTETIPYFESYDTKKVIGIQQ